MQLRSVFRTQKNWQQTQTNRKALKTSGLKRVKFFVPVFIISMYNRSEFLVFLLVGQSLIHSSTFFSFEAKIMFCTRHIKYWLIRCNLWEIRNILVYRKKHLSNFEISSSLGTRLDQVKDQLYQHSIWLKTLQIRLNNTIVNTTGNTSANVLIWWHYNFWNSMQTYLKIS